MPTNLVPVTNRSAHSFVMGPAALCAVLSIAACGSSSSSAGSTPPNSPSSPSPPSSFSVSGRVFEVILQPYMAADRQTLFFTSNRPGGCGALDLYVTTRTKIGNAGE